MARSFGELGAWLLRKLMRSRPACWGGAYQSKDDIFRNLRRFPLDKKTLEKQVIPGLLNRGWLIPHKKGNCLSLNAHHKNEIIGFVKKYYP
ncbi:MAG: hypothetical protein KAW41_06155 [Candidatus Diapherotrites archaeon]|nr:hypothetical protein [Candidatus Diapherotrites archaeon]